MPHRHSLQYGVIAFGVLVAVLAFPTLMQSQPRSHEPKLLNEMTISGQRHFDDVTLRNALRYPYLGQPWDAHRLALDLELSVKPFLKSHGFLRCVVEIERIREREIDGQISVTIHIEEGPQYRLSKLDLVGKITLFPKKVLLRVFEIKPGDPVNMVLVREGLEQIRKTYNNTGCIDFDYDQQIEIDEEAKTYDVSISISEGKCYRIGRVTFRGARAGTDSALRKASVGIHETRYFSPFLLEQTIVAINELALYDTLTRDDVRVDRRSGSWGNEVNISINLNPKMP